MYEKIETDDKEEPMDVEGEKAPIINGPEKDSPPADEVKSETPDKPEGAEEPAKDEPVC